MVNVGSKLGSAVRIARQQGIGGLLQAVGRNLGLPAYQPELDEALIAWDFFQHLGTPPGAMVDIGAHYGNALRPFVRAGWQVWAFEPDAANRSRLEAEFGSQARLKIDPRAVSSTEQTGITFYRSDVSTGISSLSAFDPSHQAGLKVDVTTLAAACRQYGIASIDFLKIDTEGHDLFVLQGLAWAEVRPRVILCEYENRKTEPLGYRYEDLCAHLLAQGYSLINSEWHPIERYGAQHRWHAMSQGSPPALSNPLGWGNVLAVRDAADLPLLAAACDRAARRSQARASAAA